jgi:hypothetical protein
MHIYIYIEIFFIFFVYVLQFHICLLITGVTSSTYFQRKSRIQIQRAGFVNQLDWIPECLSIPQICLFSMLSTPLNSSIDAINIWCPKYTSTLQKQTLQKRLRNKRHAAPVAYDCGPKSNAHKLQSPVFLAWEKDTHSSRALTLLRLWASESGGKSHGHGLES